MTNAKLNPIIRVLPSLTDLVFVTPMIIVLLLGRGASSLLEGDTGWHVRTGEWILANGRVPDTDFFSYTKAGEPWFAWEWLADILYALLHRAGGMGAVIFVNLLVICLTMAMVYRLARAKCSNDLVALAVAEVAVGASMVHWLARPHLFGWLFLVIFYWILERSKQGSRNILWFLPPLAILWTNIHASFFVGLALIGLYAAGEVAFGLFVKDSGGVRNGISSARHYILAGLGCLAASFFNPYSYHLHLHVLAFLRDPYAFNNISEYQATALRGGFAHFLEPMLALAIVAAVWNLRKRRFAEALILLFWAHQSMAVIRNVPVFAILAAPLIAEFLNAMLAALKSAPVAGWLESAGREFGEIAGEFGAIDRPWRTHLASAAACAVVLVVLCSPNARSRSRSGYDSKIYPEAALSVLKSQPRQARIFTDDEWGDFLIYSLYPERRVFVDGRADFYGSKFNTIYVDIMRVSYDWEQKLAAQGVDTVLLSTKCPLVGALKESWRWRTIYDDGLAIVFTKTGDPVYAGRPPGSESMRFGGSRDRRIASVLTNVVTDHQKSN